MILQFFFVWRVYLCGTETAPAFLHQVLLRFHCLTRFLADWERGKHAGNQGVFCGTSQGVSQSMLIIWRSRKVCSHFGVVFCQCTRRGGLVISDPGYSPLKGSRDFLVSHIFPADSRSTFGHWARRSSLFGFQFHSLGIQSPSENGFSFTP